MAGRGPGGTHYPAAGDNFGLRRAAVGGFQRDPAAGGNFGLRRAAVGGFQRAAREGESAALAMLSITMLPASNMLSRSSGPAAVTVSRSGLRATIILRLVGW